ncbi:helix-turn-helix domain-containing protein [Lonepinella koalarum]|uniref:AraC family transcriptional regulator n=1 Tax=Lonepinella koalarum TaxID=53417 RepID=A0A4R1KN97_9PAST|nr:helix-turn-helix domain-containing protein [Lonepinella koalarum]MDH2925796.1 hypothetical protein [Lonepinella koalarum]TCK66536.1 AraC family transcriptional regulator [Lonepinella koalarum]TFJ89004.1 helix-turn-helix domain-containing protein [Lonepinella koalarum]
MFTRLSYKDFFRSSQQLLAIEPRLPQENYPEHTHDFNELVLVTKGSGRHILNGYPHELHQGMVLYINADDHHLYENVDNLHLTNILLKPKNDFKFIHNVDAILQDLAPNQSQYKMVKHQVLSNINQQIALLQQDPLNALQQESSFLQILNLVQQNQYCVNVNQDSRGGRDENLYQLLRYLSFNFKQEINWQQLSQDFQLPLRSLQRMVKEKLGITPQQYVNKLRLSYAYYQLKFSEKAIIDIALESGYSDSSYFASCFKHEFGFCPRELR